MDTLFCETIRILKEPRFLIRLPQKNVIKRDRANIHWMKTGSEDGGYGARK